MKLTLPQIKYCEHYGYTVKLKDFGHLQSMVNGNRHVWPVKIKRYTYEFMTADLIAGKFCNHQDLPTLKQAIARPLTEV